MKKVTLPLTLFLLIFTTGVSYGLNDPGSGTAEQSSEAASPSAEQSGAAQSLSLITATPEEGFQLAITLSRKGVTETQPDREVLFSLRDVYANDPDALIASSQVIAIHFQTVAAANNYWKD